VGIIKSSHFVNYFMANGNNIPPGPRRRSVRPGPIRTSVPQQLQTPGAIIDQAAVGGVQNHAGAGARNVLDNG